MCELRDTTTHYLRNNTSGHMQPHDGPRGADLAIIGAPDAAAAARAANAAAIHWRHGTCPTIDYVRLGPGRVVVC